jgi:hypothetical protein
VLNASSSSNAPGPMVLMRCCKPLRPKKAGPGTFKGRSKDTDSPVFTFSFVTFAIRWGVRRFRRPSSSWPPQNQALSFGVPAMCGRAERFGKVDASPLGFSRILNDLVIAQELLGRMVFLDLGMLEMDIDTFGDGGQHVNAFHVT